MLASPEGGATWLQLLQQIAITSDKRFLLRPCPSLQLMLAPERRAERVELFGIDERHRPPARRVSRTATLVVDSLSSPWVFGAAGVQSAVGAAKDVDEVHANDDAIVDGAGASPSTRSLRSLAQGIRPFGGLP